MKRAVIAFDPGQYGAGFCITEDRETHLCEFYKTVIGPRGGVKLIAQPFEVRARWIQDMSIAYDVLAVGVEDVHSHTGEGVTSAFNFGKDKGVIMGMVLAGFYRIFLISISAWQAFHRLKGKHGELGCSPDQEKKARKTAHTKVAAKLFGERHTVTLENADAMLMADYLWWEIFGNEVFKNGRP